MDLMLSRFLSDYAFDLIATGISGSGSLFASPLSELCLLPKISLLGIAIGSGFFKSSNSWSAYGSLSGIECVWFLFSSYCKGSLFLCSRSLSNFWGVSKEILFFLCYKTNGWKPPDFKGACFSFAINFLFGVFEEPWSSGPLGLFGGFTRPIFVALKRLCSFSNESTISLQFVERCESGYQVLVDTS